MLGVLLIGIGVAMCVLRMVNLVYTPDAQLNQKHTKLVKMQAYQHHMVSHLDVVGCLWAPALHVHHCQSEAFVSSENHVLICCTGASSKFLADLGELSLV